MTDIVGKLRIFASHRNPSRTMDKGTIAEAADEIERLRAMLEKISKECDEDYTQRFDDQEAMEAFWNNIDGWAYKALNPTSDSDTGQTDG